MTIGTGSDQTGQQALEALLRDIGEIDLQDIDPDALREAEFAQQQWVLDELPGKTIVSATLEENRVVIETGDGNRYFFYGFMGGGGRPT
jgi:hypothetical protein